MTQVDRYVASPAEPAPTPRLQGLRPWLLLAIFLLVVGAWSVMQLLTAREDPTLQFPGGAPTPPATAPALPAPTLPAPTLTAPSAPAPTAPEPPLPTPAPTPAPT